MGSRGETSKLYELCDQNPDQDLFHNYFEYHHHYKDFYKISFNDAKSEFKGWINTEKYWGPPIIEPAEPIGFLIRKLRKRKKLSIAALAKEVGLSASGLSMIESEKRYPSIKSIISLSTALGVSVEQLTSCSSLEVAAREALEFSEKFQDLKSLSKEEQDVVVQLAKTLKDSRLK